MQDLFLSIVDSFEEPAHESNLIIFKNEQPVVLMSDGAAYFKKCKHYAKTHSAYVVTGLMNISDYLCLCMFGPDGKICGAQRALFLSKEYIGLYKNADNLALFDTPYGKIFLCVDADVYNPEVQRHARLGGCTILVSSQWFSSGMYSEQKLYTGAWGAAQTNNFLVVSATNHAAAVCAPYLDTIDNTGFLCKPAIGAFTTFNVSRLDDAHGGYHSSHFNKDLFASHRDALLRGAQL